MKSYKIPLMDSAPPPKVKLVGETVAKILPKSFLRNCFSDKAYYSDALDNHYSEQVVEIIEPRKSNRKNLATEVGRKLRRYRRR